MKQYTPLLFASLLFGTSIATEAAPPSLTNLLLSRAWCAFSYNQNTGYSSTTRVRFFKNGTYSADQGGEGYSSGSGGTYASQSNSGAAGYWKIVKGALYMSEGEGQLQPVNLRVTKNSNGYPILIADGQEYSGCQ
jgi:hypothetical protein